MFPFPGRSGLFRSSKTHEERALTPCGLAVNPPPTATPSVFPRAVCTQLVPGYPVVGTQPAREAGHPFTNQPDLTNYTLHLQDTQAVTTRELNTTYPKYSPTGNIKVRFSSSEVSQAKAPNISFY